MAPLLEVRPACQLEQRRIGASYHEQGAAGSTYGRAPAREGEPSPKESEEDELLRYLVFVKVQVTVSPSTSVISALLSLGYQIL